MEPMITLEVGNVFARSYRVARPLRSGGMGAIYVVEQLTTGALRALKLMRPELCANERLLQLFEQEARIGHRIRSDHVIQVLDAGVEQGTPWLVMELLEGEDLAEHARRLGPLPRARAGDIIGQIGHALATAHAAGVVHRDLKPENVFLTLSRREGDPLLVKLLDFGVAKVITEAQLEGTLVGTPLWMAPEQLTGAPVSPATDVWALGLLAYWMLTGRSYWAAEHGAQLGALLTVASTPLPAASAKAAEAGRAGMLPPGFDEWFGRCVAPDPTARFADGGAAAAALRMVLCGGLAAATGDTIPIAAEVPPPPPPARKTLRGELVREVLQSLARPDCVGVALLTPLGFDAPQIVADVLTRLKRPGEPLLPVRLVPERRGWPEDGFYERLLRDLRWGVPPPWRQLVERRAEASAMDRFEYAVEDLLEGPVADAGKALLFVVEGLAHVPTPQLEHWGYMMARLSGRGLKLLVWGGQELHELRTRPASGGRFSAFHILRAIRVAPLSLADIGALLAELGEDTAAAAAVFDETRGHPALVRELLDGAPAELRSASRDAIAARLLCGEHLVRLKRALAEDPDAGAALREITASAERPAPRGRHPGGEERLRWLGVIEETGPSGWDWSAPVMSRFASSV